MLDVVVPKEGQVIVAHVNQHVIKANKKYGRHEAPLTVKVYASDKLATVKENHYCHEVEFTGPSKLVYPGEQLSCGASIWMQTTHPVFVTVRNDEQD